MADSSARKIRFEPNKEIKSEEKQRIVVSSHQVRWTGLEKSLVIVGSLITSAMMIFLVSSSISATSAQHELTNVQQSISAQEKKATDLKQQIGQLTSSQRLNKIAREKGLSLIEKNIRTIR